MELWRDCEIKSNVENENNSKSLVWMLFLSVCDEIADKVNYGKHQKNKKHF